MQTIAPPLSLLEFALEVRHAIDGGDDYGDQMRIDQDWATDRWSVSFSVYGWRRPDEERSVKQRILAIRRLLGGSFEKNDPESGSAWDSAYAVLTTQREDFEIKLVTDRSFTCTREVVSVEVIEVPAVEAHTEEKPVYRWNCEPLNDIVEDEAVPA